MQRAQRVVDEALEEFKGELGVEFADHAGLEVNRLVQTGPAREIDHHARQRLVQRHIAVAVAGDAALVAHGLGHRHAQRDADVFDGVVAVDVQVALAFDVQVDQAVARHLVEHVVEEADAGGEFALAAAVEVQANPDTGLLGVTADIGDSVLNGVGNAVHGGSRSVGFRGWRARRPVSSGFHRRCRP